MFVCFSVATVAVQAEHSSPLRTWTVREVEEQAGPPVCKQRSVFMLPQSRVSTYTSRGTAQLKVAPLPATKKSEETKTFRDTFVIRLS